MHVAVSAFVCEPGAGSEPGVGWAWAYAAAQRHDVTLLTGTRSRDAVTAALAREPDLRVTPVFLDASDAGDPPWQDDATLRKQYVRWQLRLGKRLRDLHSRRPFDITHHLTVSADWMPAGVLGLPGVPSVWGPIGGTSGSHLNLSRWFGRGYVQQEAVRLVVTGAGRASFGRRQLRRADLVVVQNDDVAAWARSTGADVVVEPCIALEDEEIAAARHAAATVPAGPGRTAVFAGRLLTWKGLLLAINALARPAASEWRLDVIGDGPDADRATSLAAELGVSDRVTLMGRVPRAEALARMAAADAVVMPTVHDSACWVVAEAAALGRPVVCLDSGGPPTVLRLSLPAGEWSGVVSCDGDVPGSIAHALATAPQGQPPTTRWTSARVPYLLDSWYAEALRRSRS